MSNISYFIFMFKWKCIVSCDSKIKRRNKKRSGAFKLTYLVYHDWGCRVDDISTNFYHINCSNNKTLKTKTKKENMYSLGHLHSSLPHSKNIVRSPKRFLLLKQRLFTFCKTTYLFMSALSSNALSSFAKLDISINFNLRSYFWR